MDNKLSELSKPVGYFTKQRDGNYWPLSKSTAKMNMVRLYSQEYVSALLAELEASKKSNAFLKERLSQLANFNPDWDMLEACRESWREVSAALKEAETRLATPVRLKKADSSSAPITRHSFNAAVNYCAKAVRAAGFKCEGDE